MFGDVIGTRDFQVLSRVHGEDELVQAGQESYQWRLLSNDYMRFSALGARERNNNQWIMLKLESPRESRLFRALVEKDKEQAYDCLAIYKYSDQSFDWLPCKIISRRLRQELAQLKEVSFNSQCFEYQVSFLHSKFILSSVIQRNILPDSLVTRMGRRKESGS